MSSSVFSDIIALYDEFVLPTYARYPINLQRGAGCRVWDEQGTEYLDFGAGIAVCSIGHCHPKLVAAISSQAERLIHTSNLYYTEAQGRLAERLVNFVGAPGKVFFCNSGGEANEGLIKLSRRYGNWTREARVEIITFHGSFHGRTMAGLSATGQDKVKVGFEPLLPGFVHVPYNDLSALRAAVSDRTVAILMEPIQGEGGIHQAGRGFLPELREICDAYGLLLMFDEVQCGLGRTGDWCGWKTVGGADIIPDAVSWAKGIASGFPMGCFWVRDREIFKTDGSKVNLCDLLGPGSHGTTFGGTPLACAAAHAVFDVIETEDLLANAAEMGAYAKDQLKNLGSVLIKEVRGVGLMLGMELAADFPCADGQTASQTMIRLLHQQRQLAIPAGASVIRWLPPLNVTRVEIDAGVAQLQTALEMAGHAAA